MAVRTSFLVTAIGESVIVFVFVGAITITNRVAVKLRMKLRIIYPQVGVMLLYLVDILGCASFSPHLRHLAYLLRLVSTNRILLLFSFSKSSTTDSERCYKGNDAVELGYTDVIFSEFVSCVRYRYIY